MLINVYKLCILFQLLGGFLMVVFPPIFTWRISSALLDHQVAFENAVDICTRMMGLQAIFIGFLLWSLYKYSQERKVFRTVCKYYVAYHFIIAGLTTLMTKQGVIDGYFPNASHALLGIAMLIGLMKEKDIKK
jgi:hypothetical protein